MPGIGLGNPTADDRSDGRRKHRQHAGERGGNTLPRDWEQEEHRRKDAGINVPPEKPCKTRHAISTGKLSLAAQPTEASVKTEMDSTNSQHMLSRRVRKPVSGIATTSAMR